MAFNTDLSEQYEKIIIGDADHGVKTRRSVDTAGSREKKKRSLYIRAIFFDINARALTAIPEVIKKYVREPEPVTHRPIRREGKPRQEKEAPFTVYLAQQRYGEQL